MTNQQLLTMSNWITLFGAVCAVLTAFLALLGLIGRNHFGKLVEQEKEAQHAQIIQGLNDDLTTERDKVARLERGASLIRSLEAELYVEFRGNWNEKPFPDNLISTPDNEFYVYLMKSENPKTDIIKLFATERYNQKEIEKGRGAFRARQSVKGGHPPLGTQIDSLLTYDTMGIHIPFSMVYDNFVTREITINRVSLTFILNGERLAPLEWNPNEQVPVRTIGDRPHTAWASYKSLPGRIPWPRENSTAVSKP